jgi:F420-dependent oxidoreductase-like protein
MDFRVTTEPQQGASYEDQLAVATACEQLGFDGFFRSDHYLVMGGGDGLPGPSDAWTTLAGIARETSRIRLGTLVTPVTFRHPGILAIQVAQVDEMSGGRIELGLGTGWYGAEHTAYGIPFPEKRFGIFEEQLEIVTGLWGTPLGDTFSFAGEHYTLTDAPALPKPVQSPIPIIIGGGGMSRTPALAAKFAADFNCSAGPLDELEARVKRVRQTCVEIGRDPESIVISLFGTVAAGATDADVRRRASATTSGPEKIAETGFYGSAAQIVDKLSAAQELGASRAYFQVFDFHDLDQLEFLAREVIPQLD